MQPRGLGLLALAAAAASDSPLQYPTPANPFATPKPPPPDDSPLPLPGLPLPLPGRDGILPAVPPAKPAAKKARGGGFRLRWQPVVCMGLLSAVCFNSRPHEPSLIVAIDEYHQGAKGLIDSSLLGEAANLKDLGLASAASHSELIWLGILGTWLPLIPISRDAIAHWWPSATAHQLICIALTLGYLLRKILPRSLAEGHLSASFSNLAKLRVWTLITAAFSPVGLVHWFHSLVVVLAVMPSLSASLSRPEQLILYLCSGAAASLGVAIGGLLARRRTQPRASVSGAIFGVVLLCAALAPDESLNIASWTVPVFRALLLHIVLDVLSNSCAGPLYTIITPHSLVHIEQTCSNATPAQLSTPPWIPTQPLALADIGTSAPPSGTSLCRSPDGGGVEKLFGLLAAATFVGTKRTELRESILEGGWQKALQYLKTAI